jgi:hypothetical protein
MAGPSFQQAQSNTSGKAKLHDGPAPSALLLALELRAFWEFGALLPTWPLLTRAPRGDGHAVMVFPGLSANDVSVRAIRPRDGNRVLTSARVPASSKTPKTA